MYNLISRRYLQPSTSRILAKLTMKQKAPQAAAIQRVRTLTPQRTDVVAEMPVCVNPTSYKYASFFVHCSRLSCQSMVRSSHFFASPLQCNGVHCFRQCKAKLCLLGTRSPIAPSTTTIMSHSGFANFCAILQRVRLPKVPISRSSTSTSLPDPHEIPRYESLRGNLLTIHAVPPFETTFLDLTAEDVYADRIKSFLQTGR
jgi:hypothetical protein